MLSPLFVLPFFLVGILCQSTGLPTGETDQASGATETARSTVQGSEGTGGLSGATEQGSEGTGATEQSSEGSTGGSSEQPGADLIPGVPGSCSELKCRDGFNCVVQSPFCWIGIFCIKPLPTCVSTCRDPNEVWDSCPSCVTDYLCGHGLPICLESPLPCQPRCVCKEGWVRNVDGSCIAIEKCLSSIGNVSGGLDGQTGGETGATTVRGARTSTVSP